MDNVVIVKAAHYMHNGIALADVAQELVAKACTLAGTCLLYTSGKVLSASSFRTLYNWAYHKKTGYAWWVRRVRHALGIYDLLRIDHFRGFDTYWAIPADSTTARTGKWENGPGMELFDALEEMCIRDSLHAVLAQTADALDGGLDVLHHDAVTALELLMALVHVVAKQGRIHRGCDLCRAGGLCAVAHDAGHDGQRIDHRVDGGLIAVAAQIYDARASARTGADCAAVGGQGADAGLFVDGHQIGNEMCIRDRVTGKHRNAAQQQRAHTVQKTGHAQHRQDVYKRQSLWCSR